MTTTSPRLAGRLALVTGATRGIGRAVALAYAKEGAHLILVGRTAGALEEVDDEIRSLGGNATLLTLDLKQHDKIDALGPTIYQRWNKLDILVGNAGVLGPLSPLGHITAEAWNEVMEVNITANWRLIRTLDPLLRRSDAGRAIFVTSGVASNPRAYWGPYAVSKAALEALARIYAQEMENTPVRVNLINPGPTHTAMRSKAFPGEKPETLKRPEDHVETFIALAEPGCRENGRLFDLKTGKVR
ncbi:MAG TPA: SDR family NAD(P)-dependent oxidoreductase [Hyphomicrobiaceae bacterium]|jgi:NAD(P)-dependent dehydrogenase (short-subunit alcohol dehydrogenase family)|nr:SDR family NAD(P)-dependent oxidoreductase [Hyphomicrobiaceae bacterium]